MLSRRNFLALSAATGTGALLNSLQSFATPLSKSNVAQGFKLLIFATNWGYTGSWEEFASKIKKLNYDGAELWFPADPAQRDQILSAFRKHDLQLGFLIGSGERNYQKHLDQFRASLEGAAAQKPVYINCHSGRDHFSFDQNRKFIELTTQVSRTSGVPVYHE